MARPEKTAFISYRRKDISWALAVYHYLTKHDYDVFFDYKSIPSGDFEQIIVGNIKARAHFLVILTPNALDRCSEPGDWLRREIENAISERRNIIPLFFDGFNFGASSVSEKLTGKLSRLKRYNGLEVPAGYFDEAMDRLRGRYLDVTLDAVLHPVSEEVQKKVKEHQVAANQAISSKEELEEKARKKKDAKEKREAEEQARIAAELKAKKEQEDKERRIAEEKARREEKSQARKAVLERIRKRGVESLSRILVGGMKFIQRINPKQYGIGGIVILALLLLLNGGDYIMRILSDSNIPAATKTSTITNLVSSTITPTSTIAITLTITPTETPLPTLTLGIGSTMISEKDGMVMVYVPAGDFKMGSEDGDDDEKPVHTVYLDAFWIDQTEVTNAMYMMCVEAGACNEPSDKSSETRNNYYGISEFENYPVVYVSWNDAYAYCSWADRRRPTEAEWEKAASWDVKNNIKHVYPWGNSIDCSFSNYYDGEKFCIGDTSEVGSYSNGASPYGVLDMAGNVEEWVWDTFVLDYYLNSPLKNPQGPDFSGTARVLRGGSWATFSSGVRSSNRNLDGPLSSKNYIGIRCAMNAE